ncbi:protein STICHEL, partial [Tanacetum coccineum]
SSSYSGGLVDPSNLHLKKELTKAARALRDPGTTSSWRSPLTSSRSHTALALSVTNTASANHYNHHYRLEQTADNSNHISNTSNVNINANANVNASGSSNNNYLSNNGNGSNNRSNKEKKVFLYNWRTQRSESERSASVTGHQKMSIGDGEESVDDSLSDARNDGDLRMCDSNVVTPPVRKVGLVKKKTKRGLHSSAALKFQLQRQMNMVDQYDDVNSDDVVVKGTSVTSPLLSRIRASKLLGGGSRKDDSSYCYSTPALSTSSFNKYWVGNPSTVGSWDGATGSLNDGDDGDDDDDDDDDDDQLDLPGRQGCGIPCYWSSSKRSTPKRGGVCGSCYSPSFSDTLRRKGSRSCYVTCTNGTESRDRSSIGTDDELSTNYGEIDLEALSRLDGRRWSTSYKSQEGLELVAINGEIDGGSPSSLDNINCSQLTVLSQCFFYFDCLANGDTRLWKFAGMRLSIFRARMGPTSNFIRHEVYVIDECHLLPSKLWLAFQKFLEEPPPSVVFIFITTDLDNVEARFQKKRILHVDSDALDLIALNVEGSLRDAETMLDQLSLLGKRITTDLVNELLTVGGSVSDDKLMELLDVGNVSNTADTVKRAKRTNGFRNRPYGFDFP